MGMILIGLFFFKLIEFLSVVFFMDNLEVLQKLTLGTDNVETVKIDFNGAEGEFHMRPLTDGELTQLQSIEKKPLVVKVGMQNGVRQSVQSNINDVDINTGEFTEAQSEAMYNAIAWSLSVDETVTVEDIKKLPAGLPGVLFEQVINISKLADSDLSVIKSFRKD
jgi:hypothetical protein